MIELETEVAKDWEVQLLGKLVDQQRTIRYGIVQPGDFAPEGRLMIRGQDYSSGWVSPDQMFRVSEKIEKIYKKARVKEGDIVLTIVGAGTGTVAMVPSWLEGANLTQTTARIAIDGARASKEYCFQYLRSHLGHRLTYRNIKGGAQPGLNCGDIEKYPIALPSFAEQKAIAHVLGLVDRAIELNNKIIGRKELRKRWLMQNLLTGKKRLKGFTGQWTPCRLGDVTTNFSRRNKNLIDAEVFSVTNANGFVLQSDHFDGKVAGDDLSGYKIIKNSEFAYNPARINVGSIAYFENEIGVISSLYVCFRTTKDILDYYLFQFLGIAHTKHRINALGEGGVRVYLWYELFSKIKIDLPPLEEQTAIAQILQTADKEIQLLKAKTEKLRQQKKGMMQQLLTGKKRFQLEGTD